MKRLPRPQRSTGALRRIALVLLTGILLLGAAVPIALGEARDSAPWPMTRGAGTLPPLGLYPDVAPLAANGTPCGALNPYPLSQFPDPQNVFYIFSEVCQLPEFVTLYETWGIGGFGLGYGGWLNNSSDTSVSFGFNFEANCTNTSLGPADTLCSFVVSWTGNLSDNNFTGPFVEEFTLTFFGGPPATTGASPAVFNAWVLLVVAGIGALIVSAVAIVTSRRRTALRQAILLPDSNLSGSMPGEVAEPQPPQKTPTHPPGGTSEPPDSTDTLEDLF